MRSVAQLIHSNAINARMPTVKVDDGKVDIYYETHGEGPEKVLFITGNQLSADYVWNHLRARIPN